MVGSQLLMLGPNLQKIPNSYVQGGWKGGGLEANFDAKSKFATVPNSHVQGGWAGGGEVGGHFLMLSPNLLKSQIPMSRVGWQVGGGGLAANF